MDDTKFNSHKRRIKSKINKILKTYEFDNIKCENFGINPIPNMFSGNYDWSVTIFPKGDSRSQYICRIFEDEGFCAKVDLAKNSIEYCVVILGSIKGNEPCVKIENYIYSVDNIFSHYINEI
tara:strand:+ start:3185 stop:3550 length:366 start_codon:yes stop_codon:yes gene_type:complete